MKTLRILKYYIAIVILGLSVNANAYADGGSNYSLFGIGDLIKSNNAVYSGMAGTALAVPSIHAINPLNPALWGKVTTSRLQVGYMFSQNSIKDMGINTDQNNGGVGSIAGLLSVDTTLGIGISFGLTPYSSIHYLSSYPIGVNLDDEYIQGKSTYEGSGGLTQFYLGSSVKLFGGLYFGAAAFATFGSITNTVSTELYDFYSYTSETTRKDYFTGFGYKAGLFYEYGNFGIGGYYEGHTSDSISSDIIYESDAMDAKTLYDGKTYTLPNSFGLGVSYKSGKFLFASDIGFQDFTNFNYNKSDSVEYKNSMFLSFGLSRLGNTSAGTNYWDKVTYNLGFGYRDQYFSVYNNGKMNEIQDMYGSFGMIMPISGYTKLDVSLQIGSRGVNETGLVHEIYGKFMVNLSIGEDSWFKPFKRSYK